MEARNIDECYGNNFSIFRGDCVKLIERLDSDSIGLNIFSPPFGGTLYTFSNDYQDFGNCVDNGQFFQQYDFLASEQYRTLKPGRLLAFHCMNIPSSKARDGFIGLSDFRGDLIRLYQKHGFIYHSEVCIFRDPVVQMQRTKALGLLHKQVKKDSAMSRQGLPDYLVVMRKPGVNDEPIKGRFDHYVGENKPHPTGDPEKDSINIWQNYAAPVWFDINQSDTLQYQSARSNNDERHITPIQLPVVHRALQLWSNPGDTVLSPFMGIGSEGYESLKMGRKFIGFELKESYFNCAVNNLKSVESSDQLSLLESAS